MIPDFKLVSDSLWFYRAIVLRVIDGDTVVLLIDKGMNEFAKIHARLAGIDAPELRPRVGSPEQRAVEKQLAEVATNRLRELIESKEVLIRTSKTGKYGRYLVHIFLDNRPVKTVNDILVEENLAVAYGSPRPWRQES